MKYFCFFVSDDMRMFSPSGAISHQYTNAAFHSHSGDQFGGPPAARKMENVAHPRENRLLRPEKRPNPVMPNSANHVNRLESTSYQEPLHVCISKLMRRQSAMVIFVQFTGTA